MALFQVSVLKNYLKLQEEQLVDKAYQKFSSYFQHPEIQENIRKSKEEQFQATFLNELFVNILGYTLNPNPNYNLSTEFKNESNNRKADGAILKDGNAIGVIELKGTNTKHLEGIRQQAFDYKANQKHCVYVITSNFEKLRFYIQDATDFLEFDLFELNREDFSLLWLCLHKENLINNLPLKIKEASIGEEEEITKEFYKDYSLFKRELFQDLVQRNVERLKDETPDYGTDAGNTSSEIISETQVDTETEKQIKLNLFKKSQKLIDRFLFIFFAEDRGLLPPNAIINILAEWNQLKDLDAEIPLYQRFKQYFGYLNHGRPATETRPEIYAYNGGLFKPDELLDGLEIDDHLLYKHTSKLAKYDFESQVDVNILGHIFENSLNEIESINAEIKGAEFDKQKSKRKKDGVFYTPKYITKYIVENTIGRLCEEKKSELGFREEEYFKGRKRRQKDTLEGLVKILDDYREWLLQLSICDPACGSGAFLNQALDFLIKEHRYIDELKAKLLGGSLILSDIENTILERNIYGVDINEESVEIAKLSLWLRTAQPSRKLNDLSNNVKCGNSLIDDEAVAGSKAFKWEEEFPEVFAEGGFDVVIGNPPYGAKIDSAAEIFYRNRYNTATYQIDTFPLFCELGINLLTDHGKLSFIIPSSWVNSTYGVELRKLLIVKVDLKEIIITNRKTFEDATVETLILSFNKKFPDEEFVVKRWDINTEPFKVSTKEINTENKYFFPVYSNPTSYNLIKKVRESFLTMNYYLDFVWGVKVYQKGKGDPKQSGVESKLKSFHLDTASKKNHLPLIGGKNISRYKIEESGEFLNYGPWLAEPRSPDWFTTTEKRILIREVTSKGVIQAGISFQPSVFTNSVDGAKLNAQSKNLELEFFLGLLNSRFISFYHLNSSPNSFKNSFPKLLISDLNNLPVPTVNIKTDAYHVIVQKVKEINSVTNYKKEVTTKFLQHIISKYNMDEPTKKLREWSSLTESDFLKELRKNDIILSLQEESDWIEYFKNSKDETVILQKKINDLDGAIDQMVYKLYELTDEEIQLVENQ